MTTDWKALAAACDKDIVQNDYYVNIWKEVRGDLPFEQRTKFEALAPFHEFWERLPDRAAIQRPPFATICDLSEEFVFGPPEAH